MSLMIPEFFGGEGGVSANRVVGKPFMGITFGPQIQVYYLLALYTFVCTAAMFAFTRTPLGRMLNAVRDNPERVEFIGYSTQRVRYLVVHHRRLLRRHRRRHVRRSTSRSPPPRSSAPAARAPTCCSPSSAARPSSSARSSARVLMVLGFVLFSELTQGVAALPRPDLPVHGDVRAGRHRQPDHDERARRRATASCTGCWSWYAVLAATALVDAGRRGGADRDGLPPAARHRDRLDAALPGPHARRRQRRRSWLGALAVTVVGFAAFEVVRRRFAVDWGAIQSEIERDMTFKEPDVAAPTGGAAAPPKPRRASHDDGSAPRRRAEGPAQVLRQDRDHPRRQPAVAPGERVAIIGPNGAGKSTLFNLISGRFGPTSGEILLNGKRIDGLLPYEINRLGLARSFQITQHLRRGCRCSRTCAAACCGRWATATRSGSSWPTCTTPTSAPSSCCAMIRLERKRDTLAMNLTYAEQRALEIGITIAGGAERGPARRADRRHEQERDRRASSS